MKMLVLVSGKAGSGKDTDQHLHERLSFTKSKKLKDENQDLRFLVLSRNRDHTTP